MDGAGVLLGSPEVNEQFFVANLACDRLRSLQGQEQPFSMVISMWGPHHPYYPSAAFADLINPADIPKYPSFDEDLSDKPWRYRVQRDLRCQHRAFERWPDWETWQTVLARCYASGLQTDAAIGRIAACLDDTGLADNTIFIVTADHGDGIAAHGAGWDKYSSFTEEVGRIPLVVRYPAKIPAGTKVETPVSLLDVTATMLDVAGVKDDQHPLPMDGTSLVGIVDKSHARDSLICDHFGHSGDISFQKILYLDGWKYVSVWGDDDELYCLDDDPYELNNRLDDAQTLARQRIMRDKIIDHMTERRKQRSAWHPAEFWEDGIVFSSAEWPREETLHLYKLRTQQGYAV
jgi:arylsulfatase A-like enzyme